MMCRSGSDVCKHRLLENIPEECFNFIVKGGEKKWNEAVVIFFQRDMSMELIFYTDMNRSQK